MKLIKCLFIASVLTVRTCQSEIVVPNPSPDQSTNLVKDLVKIVTSCYGDRFHTVGLAGSLPDALSRTLSTEHSISVVLIDDAREDTPEAFFVPVQFRQKVHVFIIQASTSQQLDVTIQTNIKLSIWWNHMASFLILDRSPGCVNSGKFLRTAWYSDVLNAKVLCHGNESARTIYNYNPFTDKAPVPWKRSRLTVRRGTINHPFTLFYRKYRANASICINLDFDKTRDLGGYEIRVDRPNLSHLKSKKIYNSVVRYVSLSEKIMSTVCWALNGTTKFSTNKLTGNLTIDTDIGVFIDTIDAGTPDELKAYRFTVTGSVLISQFRDDKSQLKKILRVIDVDLRIAIAVVCLITFIFLKFIVRQAIVPAFLNIIRVTCNARFTRLPDNTGSRIFTSFLLIFSLMIQGIVQCRLAVRLMTKIPLQNVNTMEDIETFGYKLCGDFTDDDFRNPDLNKGNLLHGNSKDCYRHVKNDTSIAYLSDSLAFHLDEARELNMHVSRKFVAAYHMSFPIRWNWALEQTFNRIIAKFVEADAIEPWNLKFSPAELRDLRVDEEVKYTEDYKPLNFDELKFAFRFLGIGLASAMVSFILESVIGYKCTCRIKAEPTIAQLHRSDG